MEGLCLKFGKTINDRVSNILNAFLYIFSKVIFYNFANKAYLIGALHSVIFFISLWTGYHITCKGNILSRYIRILILIYHTKSSTKVSENDCGFHIYLHLAAFFCSCWWTDRSGGTGRCGHAHEPDSDEFHRTSCCEYHPLTNTQVVYKVSKIQMPKL